MKAQNRSRVCTGSARTLLVALAATTLAVGEASADASKYTETSLTLTPSSVSVGDPFTASGATLWFPAAPANFNAVKAVKEGSVDVVVYENDDCTGAELSSASASIVDSAWSTGMTAPSEPGAYGVRASFDGKDAGGSPALDPSESPCRVLTVVEDEAPPDCEEEGNCEPELSFVCDYPAAPAIAAHWLQGEGVKSGSTLFKNTVSRVAHGNTTIGDAAWEFGWTDPRDEVFYPRCLEEGELDEETNTVHLFENPDFVPVVEDFTEYAVANPISKK